MAKILLIDDDRDLVTAIRIFLEARGYEVVTAHSADEGLRRVKEVNPDLILLDVMMDQRTDGFQVSLALRSKVRDSEYAAYRNTPILMLTSIHDTTSVRFAPDEEYLPVNAFMEKGTPLDAMLAKIEELLGRTAQQA